MLIIVNFENKTYYRDERNNMWNALIVTREEANECSESLINCEYCIDCTDCTDCSTCRDCHDCINVTSSRDCIRCVNCHDYCDECTDCTDCIQAKNKNSVNGYRPYLYGYDFGKDQPSLSDIMKLQRRIK